jgi:hypothetical protein
MGSLQSMMNWRAHRALLGKHVLPEQVVKPCRPVANVTTLQQGCVGRALLLTHSVTLRNPWLTSSSNHRPARSLYIAAQFKLAARWHSAANRASHKTPSCYLQPDPLQQAALCMKQVKCRLSCTAQTPSCRQSGPPPSGKETSCCR